MIINVISCNFERNGGGDAALWKAMHDRLASHRPHLLLRQEVWDASKDGETLADAADSRLGLRGYIGEGTFTSVAFDPKVFVSLRGFSAGAISAMPFTCRALQLLEAGEDSLPLTVASIHLNYASVTYRQAESEWATTILDKARPVGPNKVSMKLPGLYGVDANSYPEPRPGEIPLPRAEEIKDKQHLVHRARRNAAGQWEMDTEPDRIWRVSGVEDVAWHAMDNKLGRNHGLAPTTRATTTHGPAARPDRIYLAEELLPAVVEVEVIDMTGLSDHDAVLCRIDTGVLADELAALYRLREQNPLYAPAAS
ncbi:endonuclease/exonuclease/phosphatase family protein [Streptacidiphilus cavernicola]|uniref:Endonuclease/exonuclease/phosphatase family protein n=1 Tax=Streptacidiphilus cavernicola TaxID=3342716 RepID=A0ABV6VZ16_9ACTN